MIAFKSRQLPLLLLGTVLLLRNNECSCFVPSSPTFNPSLSSPTLSFGIHDLRHRQALRSSNENEDMSGGVFFDGPTDFKDRSSSWSSSSSNSKLRLEGDAREKEQKQQQHQQQQQTQQQTHKINSIPKDVVIIGAGLAGLSAALQISLRSNRQVTIVEKEDPMQQMKKTPAASFAAAGMLAPHSERLPSGPLLDLCLQSREMYTEFVSTIESITSNCGNGSASKKYLWTKEEEETSGLEPWEVGYSSTGGFLAPAFAGDSVATWSPPAQVQETAMWLDEVQVQEMEPSLHPDVIGGWWFPEDASVDARRLTCALRAACMERGVQFMWGGDEGTVKSLDLGGGKCKGVHLNDGRVLLANSVVVANGSWMRNLLPVPVTPHKGQSFSLRMPQNTEPLLSRILFAQDTYIVPKADGRIVVGATVEVGTFDCDVTPSGMMHCMANALQLVPGLADLPVEETWAGLRPTTPDKGPILGRTKWDNLFLAGGYWRNGVLLAPKTGQLIADLVINNGETLNDENDESLLQAFNWDRFTTPGGGKTLAANARYAASMHPVHKRSSGVGVAASVGTELGFYSGADAAKDERKRDRESLFQDLSMSEDEEHAFEKAAKLGLSDATAFASFGDAIEKPRITSLETQAIDDDNRESKTEAFDGYPDALTVGYESSVSNDTDNANPTTSKDESSSNLDEIYKSIQKKKAEVSKNGVQMNQSSDDEKPDPAFRIFHVEKGTRKEREVPPYTNPNDFFASISNEETESEKQDSLSDTKNQNSALEIIKEKEDLLPATEEQSSESDYDETTFDGYQTIQKANSRLTREEELIAMRKARMSNRLDVSQIERANIGVMKQAETNPQNTQTKDSGSKDINQIYDQILANKKCKTPSDVVKMERSESTDEKIDPGFRVYHIHKDSRDITEVPPYTSPDEHLNSLERNTGNVKSNGKANEEQEHAWGE